MGERRSARSGPGGHVRSQDVVWVAVEVLAGSVITHRGARIRMAGGDLDIPQVDPSIQHGRDERVPEHMWVRAGNSHSGGFSKPPQAACCGMPVHADAAAVEEDGSTGTAADGPVDGPSNSWRQRDQRDLGAFAAHAAPGGRAPRQGR